MPYPLAAAYNGSKAALAQYSETLRLELEPLQIKVVTVVTGQVASNLPILPQLQETSIYKPLEAALRERTKTHRGEFFPFEPAQCCVPELV
jgi:1-acylglycerone phosphate reductase